MTSPRRKRASAAAAGDAEAPGRVAQYVDEATRMRKDLNKLLEHAMLEEDAAGADVGRGDKLAPETVADQARHATT